MIDAILQSPAAANTVIGLAVALVVGCMYPAEVRKLLARIKRKPAPPTSEAAGLIRELQIIALSRPAACRDKCLDALDILGTELAARQVIDSETT